jgi:hypothetical protein
MVVGNATDNAMVLPEDVVLMVGLMVEQLLLRRLVLVLWLLLSMLLVCQ